MKVRGDEGKADGLDRSPFGLNDLPASLAEALLGDLNEIASDLDELIAVRTKVEILKRRLANSLGAARLLRSPGCPSERRKAA